MWKGKRIRTGEENWKKIKDPLKGKELCKVLNSQEGRNSSKLHGEGSGNIGIVYSILLVEL